MTLDTAQIHLDKLKKLAAAQIKSCRVAARNEGLVLVDADRLAALERTVAALHIAFKVTTMTRDYADAIERGKTTYQGKQYLIGRQEFEAVFRAVAGVKGFTGLPAGSLAPSPSDEA